MNDDIERAVAETLAADIREVQNLVAPPAVRRILQLACTHRRRDNRFFICLDCGMTDKEFLMAHGGEKSN